MPVDYTREAARAIVGRAVDEKFQLNAIEVYDLLDMLGITNQEDTQTEEEKQPHDLQSKYRHYRTIGVA